MNNTENTNFSCYSHAIALVTRAILNGLSGGTLSERRVIVQSRSGRDDQDEGDGEDEEDIDELLSTLNQRVGEDIGTNAEEKVVAMLLTKVRAFIAKVRFYIPITTVY